MQTVKNSKSTHHTPVSVILQCNYISPNSITPT